MDYLKHVVNPRYRRLMIAFGLYTYFYLEAELLFTGVIGSKMGEAMAAVFYGILCLVAALGLFSYALTGRWLRTHEVERRFNSTLCGIGVVCTLAAAFSDDWFLAASLLLTMLIAGRLGAYLLYKIAICVHEKSTIGSFIAISYASAFLLQHILGYITPMFGTHEILAQFILIAAALIIVGILASRSISETKMTNETDREPERASEARRHLIGALIACLIISCLFGLVDGIVMALHTGQQLNVYNWVRLLCIPGLLITGWLADYKRGRFFPFASAIAWVIIIAGVLLFDTAETFNAALGMIYFFGSAMTMYSIMPFIAMAEDTRTPAFWASAGRGVKYLAGGIFALLGSIIYSQFNPMILTLIYLVLLTILFIVLFFQGRLTPNEISEKAANEPLIPNMDSPESLMKEYGFTKRETEVLHLLLKGYSTPAIAEKMAVTEKTVYNYVGALLSKTDTQCRAAMLVLFSQKSNDI